MARKAVRLSILKARLINFESLASELTKVCQDSIEAKNARADVKRLRARIARRERDEAMRDMGMTKVRGNLGGTYWE